MLGSSASVADPNIILNTAVAESLDQLSAKLEGVPAEDMEKTVHQLLKDTIIAHKRVIFNGNGYTDEWVAEAEKRGLYNLKSTPEALAQYISEKNEALLTGHKIFTHSELHSRYEIKLENYSKIIHIEAETMAEMVQKDFLPSVITYTEQLARTASLKKSVLPDISVSSEAKLLTKLAGLQDAICEALETLKASTKAAASIEDVQELANYYQSQVVSDMEALRKFVDEAETLLPESVLPYPTYGKLLFSVY